MSDVSTKQSGQPKNIIHPIWQQNSAQVIAKPVCTSCARKYPAGVFVPYLHDRLCTVERCENFAAFLYIL